MEVTVSSLHSYPVKSGGASDHQTARVGLRGLPYDRHWMLVDQKDRFLSQRRVPKMALLEVSIGESLLVNFPGMEELSISLEASDGPVLYISMHRAVDCFEVVSEEETVSDWFSKALAATMA